MISPYMDLVYEAFVSNTRNQHRWGQLYKLGADIQHPLLRRSYWHHKYTIGYLIKKISFLLVTHQYIQRGIHWNYTSSGAGKQKTPSYRRMYLTFAGIGY
jgi:hypothetical protein